MFFSPLYFSGKEDLQIGVDLSDKETIIKDGCSWLTKLAVSTGKEKLQFKGGIESLEPEGSQFAYIPPTYTDISSFNYTFLILTFFTSEKFKIYKMLSCTFF